MKLPKTTFKTLFCTVNDIQQIPPNDISAVNNRHVSILIIDFLLLIITIDPSLNLIKNAERFIIIFDLRIFLCIISKVINDILCVVTICYCNHGWKHRTPLFPFLRVIHKLHFINRINLYSTVEHIIAVMLANISMIQISACCRIRSTKIYRQNCRCLLKIPHFQIYQWNFIIVDCNIFLLFLAVIRIVQIIRFFFFKEIQIIEFFFT